MPEMLSRNPGFDSIPLPGLQHLALRGHQRAFLAGSQLMHQGDPSDCMYLIVIGQVRVERAHPDLIEPLVLAELGPGDVVGEMGLLDAGPRSATVVAVEDTETLEISPDALREVIDRFPEVSGVLLQLLTRRLRSTNELIDAVTRRSNPDREL
jgi:CRP-like cAMP-binding protein